VMRKHSSRAASYQHVSTQKGIKPNIAALCGKNSSTASKS
jgi:hypothetical protein